MKRWRAAAHVVLGMNFEPRNCRMLIDDGMMVPETQAYPRFGGNQATLPRRVRQLAIQVKPVSARFEAAALDLWRSRLPAE